MHADAIDVNVDVGHDWVPLFSLGLMVFLFRLDLHHLAFIALLVSVSTSLIVLIVTVAEFNPERILERDAKITMLLSSLKPRFGRCTFLVIFWAE